MVNNFNNPGDPIAKETVNPKNGINKFKTGKIQYLNFGEDDQMEIQGFVFSKLKTRLVWVMYILTLGILRLIFHWYPHLKLSATHTKCSLAEAEKVLITDSCNGRVHLYFVKDVIILKGRNQCVDGNDKNHERLLKFSLCDGTKKEISSVRIIRCKKMTYIWDEQRQKFFKLAGLENDLTRSELHRFVGQNKEEQAVKRIIYGNNEINVPVQTIFTLLVLEALTPFYIFQLFSLTVWFAESYYFYTIAIIIMSVFGIATSVVQTRKNQKNLKGTVHSSDKALVCRGDGTVEEIPTTDLVPGDVFTIPSSGCEMQCDAVLLKGTCIVNESMLTGESVPVTKNHLPNNRTSFNVKEDINHTLFCGTKVIQIRNQDNEEVKAVVIRTGYLTTKGELVRSILYPPAADFKFDQDSYKFIAILCFIATLGFIYTVASKISRNIAALDILIKALDIITIAVPPALPAAMTVGKLYALNRLKNSKIYCINSRVINVSGSVNCVCFDKTGTLTEDELDMWGVVPVQNNKFRPPLKNVQNLPMDSQLLRGMTSCHTLTNIDHELCGDPLDLKMFDATGWLFEDGHYCALQVKPSKRYSAGGEAFNIGIVKQFQFFSALQRMSVIIKSTDKTSFEIFCKGSPEMIMSLSKSNTVPDDVHGKLSEYTQQGYRVIAMATRALEENLSTEDVLKKHREEIEKDLDFLGLIVLENKLKPQTTGVIRTLKKADMKIVMVTGDNIQTAVTVAKECNILDTGCTAIEVSVTKPTKYDFASINYSIASSQSTLPCDIVANKNNKNGVIDIEKSKPRNYCFVVTGHSWTNLVKYFPDIIPKIVTKGTVFARMSGQQKQQLIEQLKNLGYYVAMCGDGANDCGALKAAHVGISLSEAESSVASPFTSQEPNISCTPKVIKEGRAALVTSFGVFKMMLCYSLTEFASVIILYTIDTNLSSLEYLFIDVFLVLNFSSFFGITKAYDELDPTPPKTSLLSFIPMCSIVAFMFLTVVFQVFSYHFIQGYDWFDHFVYKPENTQNYYSYENYSVFSVSLFQYITMAVVFSKGKPYRKPLYTNKIFTLSLVTMVTLCSLITVYPPNFIRSALELKLPPCFNARVTVLAIACLNFFVCLFVEDIFVEIVLARILVPKFYNVRKSKRKFLSILQELKEDDSWPNIDADSVKNVREFGGATNGGFEVNEEVVTTRC